MPHVLAPILDALWRALEALLGAAPRPDPVAIRVARAEGPRRPDRRRR